MFNYVIKRLVATIPVLVFVALFVFLLLYITPGDPAVLIAGDTASVEDIARVRTRLGLDQPFAQRFFTWGVGLVQGDFGTSVFSDMPVSTMIAQRLEPTLSLSLVSLIFTIVAAIPLGALAALFAGRWPDRVIMAFSVLGFSVPIFVVSYVMVLVFATHLGWLPVQGFTSISEGLWPFLRHMILPGVSLALVFIALIARITRASMLEVLGQDYIRTAKSKGLSLWSVVAHHCMRNAAIPIVTIIGIGIGLMITGVVVTETVFAIPGLGRLVVDAIMRRDYPVIQGVILVFSLMYVVVNLLVDVSYTFFDPRIAYK